MSYCVNFENACKIAILQEEPINAMALSAGTIEYTESICSER